MKSLNNYTARVQAAIIALFLIIAIFSALSGNAQATIRQTIDGNFEQVKNDKTDSVKVQETGKTYRTINGEIFKVYLSARGKYFIYRTAKSSGRLYKYYLPLKTN